jgi:predicted dehydrogenase
VPAHSAIPIVLIGCGAVSQQFYVPTLRVLTQTGELYVHSLVDPAAGARQEVAKAFSGAKQANTTAEVDAPAGSLAIIASPPRFHCAQTVDAFQRGWHVLCEKPMAATSAECEQMIAAGRAAQRLLAVGLYKRFFPSSRYFKELFTTPRLGALRSFSISEGGPFRWPAATPSFFNKAQTPGGVLLDIGVHVLDLLIWWLGEPATYQYSDDAMGGLETNTLLELSYGSGARGVVHLSRDWSTPNQYRFVFEHGIVAWKVNDANGITVQLSGTGSALRSQLLEPISGNLREPTPALQASNPQSFIAQLQNIAASIRGEQTLLIPGEEGLRSLKLIESCYQNRRLLEHPWFTPAEMERARQLAVSP